MTSKRAEFRRKLPREVVPVASCPDEVVRLLAVPFEDGGLDIEDYRQRWVRMCCDPPMEHVWQALSKQSTWEPSLCELAIIFTIKLPRPPDGDHSFESKTDAERLKWLRSTRAAIVRLQNLLDEGPGFVAENVIEAIPIDDLRHFLGVIGVTICEDNSDRNDVSNKWCISERDVVRAQRGTSPLTLSELLDVLLGNMSRGVPSTLTISKPRDAKVRRAKYILDITRAMESKGFRLTDEQLATIVRTMLEDDAVTPAIANKFRYRKSADAPIGVEMQHSGDESENVG